MTFDGDAARKQARAMTVHRRAKHRQSTVRQPVNATGGAGSGSSGRTFRAIRHVVWNRNGNRRKAGVGGRQTGQCKRWRRRRHRKAASHAHLAGAGGVVRIRTARTVRTDGIRAGIVGRALMVGVSHRRMRIIGRRRGHRTLLRGGEAQQTRYPHRALDGQREQQQDQNGAIEAGHGSGKANTSKRLRRIERSDCARLAKFPPCRPPSRCGHADRVAPPRPPSRRHRPGVVQRAARDSRSTTRRWPGPCRRPE